MNIINYFKNINIYLLIIIILLFIIFNKFINKQNILEYLKNILIIIYTLINISLFNYLNMFFNAIFKYNFLSIKLYLMLLIVIYSIFLYSINKITIKKYYKILNYLLFIISNIILIINIYIILTNKINILKKTNINNSIKLNNLTVVFFLNYLIIIFIIYIFNNLKTKKVQSKEDKNINNKVLTKEELINYNRKDKLYINGIDCSIILYDSNKNNIIKNYDILLNNIEDKLVNGYTLEENKKLMHICEKLNTVNVFNTSINNSILLSKLTKEEYELLKKQ